MPTPGSEIPLPLNAMTPDGSRSGTLLDHAIAIPGEWTTVGGIERGFGMGVRFVPWGVDSIVTKKLECDQPEALTTFAGFPPDAAIEPFRIEKAPTCSPLAVDARDLDERIDARMAVNRSAAFALELLD